MASKGTQLLTHEQRRQIIEAPLGIRTIGGRTWGGQDGQSHLTNNGAQGAHPTHRYTGKYDNDGRAGGMEE